MNSITLKIILGVSVGVWLLICLLIYKSSRTAAWLAGSTVGSCLFFLGATVAASFLVKRALFLAPLWLGVLVLLLLHLVAARRESGGIEPRRGGGERTGRREITGDNGHNVRDHDKEEEGADERNVRVRSLIADVSDLLADHADYNFEEILPMRYVRTRGKPARGEPCAYGQQGHDKPGVDNSGVQRQELPTPDNDLIGCEVSEVHDEFTPFLLTKKSWA